MSKNDGGPAFPRPMSDDGVPNNRGGFDYSSGKGMSLRDWFAGMAMQGILNKYSLERGAGSPWIAAHSYEIAAAMLAERDKT